MGCTGRMVALCSEADEMDFVQELPCFLFLDQVECCSAIPSAEQTRGKLAGLVELIVIIHEDHFLTQSNQI